MSNDLDVLADIRRRNDERKAAEAQGVIGGARAEFDVDFLLRYIDAKQPKTMADLDELEDYLQDLNYEHGQGETALTIRSGELFFAYCTDPDGEWFIESTDPRERMEEDEDGIFYNRLTLSTLRNCGPFTILHEAAA